MGCQPSRLVFTGLPFEASHPGAGGTLLHLRPNKAPSPACQPCFLAPTHKSACRRPTRNGGEDELISEPDEPSLWTLIKPCSRVLLSAT